MARDYRLTVTGRRSRPRSERLRRLGVGLEVDYSKLVNHVTQRVPVRDDDAPLRMEIDTQGDTMMAWGEEITVVCEVLRGWSVVTDRVTRWSVTRDSGVPQDDAVWALKPKVRNFAGSLDICLTDAENDLGNPPKGITTVFTFTAEIDDSATPVSASLDFGN